MLTIGLITFHLAAVIYRWTPEPCNISLWLLHPSTPICATFKQRFQQNNAFRDGVKVFFDIINLFCLHVGSCQAISEAQTLL